MKILLTSIGTATAVSLYKLLRKDNYIIGTDIFPIGSTAGSTIVDKFYQVPQYNSPEYIQAILNIIIQNNIDLTIPVHDFEIDRILRSSLPIEHFILVPKIWIASLFGDKLAATKAVSRLGIPIGKLITDPIQNILSKVIYRERRSVGSKGVKIIKKTEISDYFKNNCCTEHGFIQEYIEGVEYTIDIASDYRGQPFLIVPRKRIEVKAGVATKVEIVNNKTLIDYALSILSAYPIPGFSNIQFIERNGVFYFIELNYRYGGMSIASALASFNYPQLVVKNFIDHSISVPTLNDFSIKWGAIVTRYYEERIYDET